MCCKLVIARNISEGMVVLTYKESAVYVACPQGAWS
jgi:hypothetical protein